MHTNSDTEMAIPRVFNANTPFTIMTGGSELSFLSKEDNSQGCEEEKESLVQAIAPHLSRVMQHGTAKHVVTEDHGESEDNLCVCIVAQAESKTVGPCRWLNYTEAGGLYTVLLHIYSN